MIFEMCAILNGGNAFFKKINSTDYKSARKIFWNSLTDTQRDNTEYVECVYAEQTK